MNSFTLPWLAEVVLITWRSVSKKQRPPLPSELLATFVIFGGLSVVSGKQPEIASVFGWGIVVATALNLFNAENPIAIFQNPFGPAPQAVQPTPFPDYIPPRTAAGGL